MSQERELKVLISDWRKGRATRTLGQALADGYVAVLAVVILGAMIVNLLVNAQGASAACASDACVTARTIVPWAVLATVAALAASISRLFGPVVASAAEGFWLLEAPVSRRRMLASRLALVVLASILVGALLGGLVATLAGSAPVQIGAWAAASGFAAAAVVAAAAAEQGADRTWLTRLAVWVFAAIALVGFLVVVAVAAGWIAVPISAERELELSWAVAGVALIIAVLALVLALVRMDRLRRARLVSGGELVSGMAGAAFALDFGLVRDMIIERRELERGQVRSTRGTRTGIQAFVRRDWQRLQRRPQELIPVAAVLVVPYALNALGFSAFAPTISALALFGTLVPLMNGMRVLSRTAGLARLFPFDTPELRKASMVVPGAVAGVWGVLAIPAMAVNRPPAEAIPVALLVAAAAVIAATRWVTVKPVDYGTPQLATPMGAMPPALMMNMFAGFDVVLLVTVPMVFNLPWLVSAAIAVIAFFLVQGHFNMDRLQEQQEEQRKEYEKAKAERAKKR